MHHRTHVPHNRSRLIRHLAIGLLLLAAPLAAQFPEKFENLQILPEDISPADLKATMNSFKAALGVRCTFCHVREGNPPEFNYPLDKKDRKRKARVMLQMVAAINGTFLPRVKDDEHHSPSASCITCHRGKETPQE